MKTKVYLETTVVSYLTARPSRDIIVAGHLSPPTTCTPEELMEDWQ